MLPDSYFYMAHRTDHITHCVLSLATTTTWRGSWSACATPGRRGLRLKGPGRCGLRLKGQQPQAEPLWLQSGAEDVGRLSPALR